MEIDKYIAFLTIITVLLLSPGPSVLLSINNGMKYGVKHAAVGVIGNVIAFQILIILSATGIRATLATSNTFFTVLKILGAVYLVYLGFKLWFTPISAKAAGERYSLQHNSQFNIFKQAFFVTASNPKALIFVSALLPQFINTNEAFLTQTIILAITTAVIHFTIYMSYTILSSRTSLLLESDHNIRLFNKGSGLVFVAFAIALIFTRQ